MKASLRVQQLKNPRLSRASSARLDLVLRAGKHACRDGVGIRDYPHGFDIDADSRP